MGQVAARDTFAGAICGVGSESGVRAVIGLWPVSPFGSVADAMVEDSTGWRVLIAPDEGLADYVGSIYSFDEVVIGPVACERTADRLSFRGGPLRVDRGRDRALRGHGSPSGHRGQRRVERQRHR
jgi:hypothetical protein